jgi:uncharacterized protein (DUF2147 family)
MFEESLNEVIGKKNDPAKNDRTYSGEVTVKEVRNKKCLSLIHAEITSNSRW